MSKADQNTVKQQAGDQITKNNTNAGVTNTALTGNYDEFKGNASSMLPGVVAGYSDIATTGGFDPAVLGQVNSTYGDMARTGGISDADATAMYARSSEAARSTYDTAAADAQRRSAATGGYGDTSATVTGHLARAGSQAAERAVVDTDASIAGLRQSGRLAGAQGLSTTQNQVTGNRLAGLGGSTNLYGMNLNEVNATVDAILKNYQQTGQLNNQDMQILAEMANQPGIYDKIMAGVKTFGGAAAGVMSGIGAMRQP